MRWPERVIAVAVCSAISVMGIGFGRYLLGRIDRLALDRLGAIVAGTCCLLALVLGLIGHFLESRTSR